MRHQKLYRSLVVGGGLLVAGCASSQTSSSATASNLGEKEPSAPPLPSKSEAKKTPTASDEVVKVPAASPKTDELRCSECEGEGRGMMCPDPNIEGMNCCWLMAAGQHPCCPSSGLPNAPGR